MDDQKLQDFLKELTELSRKHGLVIGGCGCCGSPYIYEESVNGQYTGGDQDLQWVLNNGSKNP